jgi:rRNA maturation endonuclease Nob1
MFQVLYQLFLSKLKSEKTNGSINKKSCRNCNKKFNADFKFCPYCGTRQDKRSYNSKDTK